MFEGNYYKIKKINKRYNKHIQSINFKEILQWKHEKTPREIADILTSKYSFHVVDIEQHGKSYIYPD